MRALKYLSVFLFPLVASISFAGHGWHTFIPMIFAFGAIPIAEQLFKGSLKNLDEQQFQTFQKDKIYDLLLYFTAFTHLAFVVWFLFSISENNLSIFERVGRISTMGILFAVTGINVAHELGHRKSQFEKLLSQLLLSSTQYTHFFIEHNQGHHKLVSTHEDPASARRGESLYAFWFRSIFYQYISAWKIQMKNLKRRGNSFFSIFNYMLLYILLQLSIIGLISYFFGLTVLTYYLIAAFNGIVFLETINYLEHYGLQRKKMSDHRYELTQPWHSWNSNHFLGRVMLFELTRHSDHHFDASKKYQVLDSHDNAPTLPLGYPASILLALIPPLWFAIMNKRIDAIPELAS